MSSEGGERDRPMAWWERVKCSVGIRPRPQPLTPEQDKLVARRALGQGDLPHCAIHVAAAVLADPFDDEALHLLDELILATDTPVELFPLAEQSYAGTAAARAYALHKARRWNEAAELLRQVDLAVKDKGFWFWGIDWLCQPGAAAQVDAVHAVGLMAGAINRFPGLVVSDPASQQELRLFTAAADAVLLARPDDPSVQAICSVLFRKAGRLDEAASLAERAHAAGPTYVSGMARAMAYEALRQTDKAIVAYEEWAALNSDDANCRTDLALLLMETGRLADALRWTEQAVAAEPNHRTAEGLVLFLRHQVNGDAAARQAFRRYLTSHPGHLLEHYARSAEPYVGYLPEPQEATVNMLRQFLADPALRNPKPGDNFTFTLSHIEAPSSRLAARLVLPSVLSVRMVIERVPEPDPREPIAEVEHRLWTFDGTEPSPGLTPPPDAVAHSVAAIAATTFDVGAWWDGASGAARDLGPGAARDLLAVMVHPPPAATDVPAFAWIPRVQTAAALIAARLDEGWDRSVRRRALECLLFGPVDWTTVAGVIALAQLAVAEGIDVRPLFMQRLRETPKGGYCCYIHALVCCSLRLPHLEPDERDEFEAWRDDLERRDESSD